MFCSPKLIFGGTDGVRSRFHVYRSRARFRRCGGRRVLFSCFALSDTFSAVPRALGPVFKFCVPRHIFGVVEGVGTLGLIFYGTEGVGSRFHVLRAWTHFWRYRGHWVSFSCFALSDSFSAIPSASCPVFMFCTPGVVFSGTEGVRSRYHIFLFRTSFWRCGGRRVPFSCFALPNLFSAVPKASGLIFIFCALKLIFGGTEGVGSRFLILRVRTHFRRY
jgi:hypothetical protein